MAKLIKGVNDLATVRPDLAAQWHPTKNGDLKPEDVLVTSRQKVWWLMPYTVPEDHPVKHIRGKCFDFEWSSSVHGRRGGNGCPFLLGKATWIGFNDLATTRPELVAQWHPTKNGNLKPTDVTTKTNQKIWWLMPYDVPDDYPIENLRGKHFDFEWESVPSSRLSDSQGCPYLAGKAIWLGFNDLATTNPELAKEWHPTKNGDLTPEMVVIASHRDVWWYLPYDVPDDYPVEHLRGKHFNFEWEASVYSRSGGSGCPYLSTPAKSIWSGFNDLSTTHPKIASQWHPTKNESLTPNDVTAGSGEKAWWLFPYDVPKDYPIEHLRGKHFDFEWLSDIHARSQLNTGQDCPYLAGQSIWVGFNDLASAYPDVAAKWHPTKNGDLTPRDVTSGTQKSVWWIMPYDVPDDYHIKHLRGKHFDFEWRASIVSQTMGNDCPFLSGKAIWIGFNDLATTHPELVKEWHPVKNGTLKPTDVTFGTKRKVWWICDKGHEWLTAVTNRTHGNGCPVCNESHGEKNIRKVLENNHILFKEEYKFKDRFYKSLKDLLRDDFALLDTGGRVVATIEYHGKQHYEPRDFSGKGKAWAEKEFKAIQTRDKIKTDYLKTHNIPQLVIPYWEFDNIEEIVKQFIIDLNNRNIFIGTKRATA